MRDIVKILNIVENDPLINKKLSFVEGIKRFDDLINSVQRDIEEHLLLRTLNNPLKCVFS